MSVGFDKQMRGIVDIHNKNTVEELLIDSKDHIKTVNISKDEAVARRLKHKRPHSTPQPGIRKINQHNVDPHALIGHTLKLQAWLNKQSLNNIQEKVSNEARKEKQRYDDMLTTEEGFVKEMENLVQHKEYTDIRKKELLHKHWTSNVYRPIREQVVKETNSRAFLELFKRKRELYKEYIEHVNKKGHVFLDTIDPTEYYPMSLNPMRPGSIIAKTKQLNDALLMQDRKRLEEDRVTLQCLLGSRLSERDVQYMQQPHLPLVPLGRHGTDSNSWIAMPMADIESPVRKSSRKRMTARYACGQLENQYYGLTPTPPVSCQNRRQFIAGKSESLPYHAHVKHDHYYPQAETVTVPSIHTAQHFAQKIPCCN